MKRFLRSMILAWIAFTAVACGPAHEAPPPGDLGIEVQGLPASVELGKAFPLTITRRWTRDWEALPFDAAALQPMTFKVLSIEREAHASHWSETITGDAWLFTLEPLDAWSVGLEARALAGGSRSSARSEPLSARVLPARAPGDSLDAEIPTELHLIPPQPLVVAISCTVLAFAMWALWFLRRHSQRTQPGVVKLAPRARIAAMTTSSPRDDVDWDRWHVELSGAVRDHIEERHAVAAPRMTTDELARDGEAMERCGPRHEPSVALLRECDAVKFAAAPVEPAAAESRLAAARKLVAEDRP